jgi:hypothetical protein
LKEAHDDFFLIFLFIFLFVAFVFISSFWFGFLVAIVSRLDVSVCVLYIRGEERMVMWMLVLQLERYLLVVRYYKAPASAAACCCWWWWW